MPPPAAGRLDHGFADEIGPRYGDQVGASSSITPSTGASLTFATSICRQVGKVSLLRA